MDTRERNALSSTPMEELDEVKTDLGAPHEVVWRDFDLVMKMGSGQAARLRVDATTPRRLVGQSRACDLVIEDPAVSRRHFAAESTPEGLTVTDLGSTNGTFLNGVRIVRAFANGNDRLRIGTTELRVELAPVAGAVAPPRERFARIVGASEVMQRLYPILDRLVASVAPVLVEGPSGTGKELVAETLHEQSARAKGPFVVFDCAAPPSSSMAIGLFGRVEDGKPLPGAIHHAVGGTLFVDEIADLDPEAQTLLLRALDDGISRPGSPTQKLDVRVVASTRRDLEMSVQTGRFREDLYFKLAALRIDLPPLRERRGDVERLARHFWSEFGGRGRLGDEIVGRWVQADWLGNVSELRSAVARYVALGDPALSGLAIAEPAAAEQEPDIFAQVLGQDLALPVARQRIVDAFERKYVVRALERAGGNATAAAAASGVARRYFYTIKKRSA